MTSVTVVIPHFNRSALLEATVESALASGGDRCEVIVVDDGSSADELARIRTLSAKGVRIIERRDGNKGPSRCRNLGAKAGTSDLLIFLDSDDLMAPWCISQRIEASRGAKADLWVFPVLTFEHAPGDRSILWNCMNDGRSPLDRFIGSDPPWHTSSPIWKRESFLSIGGFNENVVYGDDSDLHMRALVSGLRAEEMESAMPDIFVRRSSEPRITNSSAKAMTASRLTRLREGARFLRTAPNAESHLKAWEGQYFVEAEWMLFNSSERGAVDEVLSAWNADMPAENRPSAAVRAYFTLAQITKSRAYPVVRLARRFAIRFLPAAYFPVRGTLENTPCSKETIQKVRTDLAR